MASKRSNTERRFSGFGPRPDKREARQEDAKDRQKDYDSLTTEQKIQLLDKPKLVSNQERCGGEAKKQRAKLAFLLEKKKAPAPVAAAEEVETQQDAEESEKKHLKAKERRRNEKKKD